MASRRTIFSIIFFSAACLFVSVPAAERPRFSGKITGGFQAPATHNSDGRRSVLKGSDARHIGGKIFEINTPRVTTYRADDSEDMIIEAPQCLFDQNTSTASSATNLSVKTADGRFSLTGQGWTWSPNDSGLTISNQIVARIIKSALGTGATNLPLSSASTNEPILVTSESFSYAGDIARFSKNVVVHDGPDTLTCEELLVEFKSPGGLQQIEAREKVHLTQAEFEISSGHALYNVSSNTIRITEKPVWKAGLREGSAGMLLMNRSNNTLFAEGSVYMKLPASNVVENATNTAAKPAEFVEVFSEQFAYHPSPATNLPGRATYSRNVRLVHPAGEVLCETLNLEFTGENDLITVLAEQNVRIASGENEAFGDRAAYDVATEKITLTGNPRWELENSSGSSDTVIFYPGTREVFALENVHMILVDTSTNFTAFSGREPASETSAPIHIYARSFSHQAPVSVFNENVRLIDPRGNMRADIVTVLSGASNQLQRIVAEHNVRIEQTNMIATGELAIYTAEEGILTLTGTPRVVSEDRIVEAEKFLINRQKNTVAIRGEYRITVPPRQKVSSGEQASNQFLLQ